MAEGEPWRNVQSIGFSGELVGISVMEGDFIQDHRGPYFYELDPRTRAMHPLKADQFKAKYGKSEFHGPSIAWGNAATDLQTSNGDKLHMSYLGCEPQEEGGPICSEEKISVNGKTFQLNRGSQCPFGCSVLMAEKWDNRLWLGLGSLGELEWYGAGIQVYDLSNAKRIYLYEEQVMGGFLPTVIARNPSDGAVWIGSNQGLRRIDSKLKEVSAFRFFEGIDPQTQIAQLELGEKDQPSNGFAMLARRLDVVDSNSFRAIINTLNPDLAKIFETSSAYVEGFYPVELNSLVPFFLGATGNNEKSVGDYAESGLCRFKDVRAEEYFLDKRLHRIKSLSSSIGVDEQCLTKFWNAGIVSPDPSKMEQLKWLQDEEENLKKVRFSRGFDKTPFEAITQNASNLRSRGNPVGLELIDEYFRESKLFYSGLFEYLVSRRQESDFAEQIANGLEILAENNVSAVIGGCYYFNVTYRKDHPELLKPRYTMAILDIATRVQKFTETYNKNSNGPLMLKACASALKSQLSNPANRDKFMTDFSVKLTPAQRDVMNRVTSGAIPSDYGPNG